MWVDQGKNGSCARSSRTLSIIIHNPPRQQRSGSTFGAVHTPDVTSDLPDYADPPEGFAPVWLASSQLAALWALLGFLLGPAVNHQNLQT